MSASVDLVPSKVIDLISEYGGYHKDECFTPACMNLKTFERCNRERHLGSRKHEVLLWMSAVISAVTEKSEIPKRIVESIFVFDNQYISDEYQERGQSAAYATHINKSRELMLKGAKLVKNKGTVMIFGPGLIEKGIIPTLAKIFNEVILVDNDERSLKILGTHEKVRTIKLDLTHGLFDKIGAILTSSDSTEAKIKRIDRLLQICFQTFQDGFEELPKVDYIISSLITSQLFSYLQRFLGGYKDLVDPKLNVLKVISENGTLISFQREMSNQHLRDIRSHSDVCYYSDTMKSHDYSFRKVWGCRKQRVIYIPAINVIPNEVVSNHLNKTTVNAKGEWYWDVVPTGPERAIGNCYIVDAFVTTNKKTITTTNSS